MSTCTKWTELAKINTLFASALTINNEIILISAGSGINCPGLLKYNAQQDTFDKWIEYPNKCGILNDNASVTLDENNILYILGGRCSNYAEIDILKINTNSKETKLWKDILYDANIFYVDETSSMIVLNNDIHIIGGQWHPKHSIFDHDSKKINHFLEINVEYNLPTMQGDINGYYHGGIIYLKSKQIILLFGGYEATAWKSNPIDTIYQYSVINNEWTKLKHKLPTVMYAFAATVTKDEKFIIIFHADFYYNDERFHQSEIYILNTNTMEFKQSKIKCPKRSMPKMGTENDECFACIVDERNSDDVQIIISGYSRYCFKLIGCSDAITLLNDLVKLISFFYSGEYVHFINVYDQKHWKIGLNLIFE